MAKRFALVVIGLASPSILAAMVFGGSIAETAFVTLSLLLPVALIALGASRRGRLTGGMVGLLAVLALLLEGSAVAILWLSHAPREDPVRGGLPPATAIMIGLLGLGLLLLVPLGYGALRPRDGPPGEPE